MCPNQPWLCQSAVGPAILTYILSVKFLIRYTTGQLKSSAMVFVVSTSSRPLLCSTKRARSCSLRHGSTFSIPVILFSSDLRFGYFHRQRSKRILLRYDQAPNPFPVYRSWGWCEHPAGFWQKQNLRSKELANRMDCRSKTPPWTWPTRAVFVRERHTSGELPRFRSQGVGSIL